jgi:putative DNA primase/helicase
MSFLTIATPFINLGIPVFPLAPKTKIPIADIEWLTAATTDPAKVALWDAEDPSRNVALVSGDYCFLEFDQLGIKSAAEEMGEQVPVTRTQKSGNGGAHFIFRATERSRKLGNRSANLNGHEWFSFRAYNKYLVGSGSVHPNGNFYRTVKDIEPIPVPDWICEFAERHGESPQPKPKSSVPVADDFDPEDLFEFYSIAGHWEDEWFVCDECPVADYRHEQSIKTGFFYDGNTFGFNCFAGGCKGSTMSAGQVIALLNQRKGEPYKEPIWEHGEDDFSGVDDVDQIPDDIFLEPVPKSVPLVSAEPVTVEPEMSAVEPEQVTVEPEQPARTVEPKPTVTEPEDPYDGVHYAAYSENDDFNTGLLIKSMDKYEVTALRWMWPQKIPRGKIVLFTGKPDSGKSLSSLDVIARITTGRDWPDGSKNELPPSRVMVAFTEDDPNDTTAPRLIAAGADLSKVENIVGTMMEIKTRGKTSKKARKNLDLKRDCNILLEALKKSPDIALLVLDPISSFFGAGADQNKDADVRPLMDEIAKMCRKSGMTVIGIVHSNKKEGLDAVQRVSGASALAASSRAVWGFSKDKEDKGAYHMAHVKGNLAEDKSGLNYTIEGVSVITTSGEETSAPHIVWGTKLEEDADDLSAAERQNRDKKDSKLIQAKAIIRVQKYPLKLNEFYSAMESETGISSDTLKRARAELCREGFITTVGKVTGREGYFWLRPSEAGAIETEMEKRMLEAVDAI